MCFTCVSNYFLPHSVCNSVCSSLSDHCVIVISPLPSPVCILIPSRLSPCCLTVILFWKNWKKLYLHLSLKIPAYNVFNTTQPVFSPTPHYSKPMFVWCLISALKALNDDSKNPLSCFCQIEVRDRREPRYGVQRLHWGENKWHWKTSLPLVSVFSHPSTIYFFPMIRISPNLNADTKCTGFCKI